MAGNTRAEVEKECYQILGERDVSNEYSPAIVQTKINDVYKRICHGRVIRLDNDQEIKSKRLPFLDAKTPIVFHSPSSVAAPGAAIGATTIPIADTTHYIVPTGSPIVPETVYVNQNIVKYTGVSATELTGVTGLVVPLSAGDIVQQLFLISNINVFKPTKLSNKAGYPCHYITQGDYTTSKYYTILNEGESRYLLLNKYNDDTYWLDYTKEVVDLTAGTDVLELPGDTGIYVVAPIAMAELLWKTEEIEFAKEKGKLGYNALVEFYDSYNSQLRKERQQIGYNFVSSDEILGPRNAGTFGDDMD